MSENRSLTVREQIDSISRDLNPTGPVDYGTPAGGNVHVGGGGESGEVARIREQIAAITSLAHTGRTRDSERYEAMQPELVALHQQLAAAQGGRTLAAAASGTASLATYPAFHDVGQAPDVLREQKFAWGRALPKLAKAGITPTQAVSLLKIMRESDDDLEQHRIDQAKAVRASTKRALGERYGGDWQRDVTRGNEKARQLLPNGEASRLLGLQLLDGSLLGDNELICRLMIELARGGPSR